MTEASKPHSMAETIRAALSELKRCADATRPSTADPMYDPVIQKADDAHFALDGLLEQLEAVTAERDRLRAAFDRLDHAVGDLDDLAEDLSHGIAASNPASKPYPPREYVMTSDGWQPDPDQPGYNQERRSES